MGRSVNVPSGAIQTVYLYTGEYDNEDDCDYFYDDLREVIQERFPSFGWTWRGKEELVILENEHAFIVVCGYGSIVSVSVVPRDENLALARAWCSQIKFTQYMAKRNPKNFLTRIGTMSNGESVYRLLEQNNERRN